MKQCPQCNKTYDDAALFCEVCGSKLTEQTAASSDRRTVAVVDDNAETVRDRNQPQNRVAAEAENHTMAVNRPQNDAPAGGGQPRNHVDAEKAYHTMAVNRPDESAAHNPPQYRDEGANHTVAVHRPQNDAPGGQSWNAGPAAGGQPQNRGAQPAGGSRRNPINRNYDRPMRNTAAQRSNPPVSVRTEKRSKKGRIAVIELLLLIVLIAAFCVIGYIRTNPTRTAEDYFNAMADGDYETIEKLTDLPDSPFLTEEAFRTACETWSPLAVEGSLKETNASEYGGWVGSIFGLFDDHKTVQIEYRVSGNSGSRTYDIDLKGGEKRVMFLFHEWEVENCTPFLAEDFTITVPSGATLVVDDYVVDESFLQENEAGDSYVLDLFKGEHSITVLIDGFDARTESYTLEENGEVLALCNSNGFTVSDATQNAVVQQAKALMKQVYTGALNEEGSSNALAGFRGTALEEMTTEYEDLVDELHEDGDQSLTAITLDEFDVSEWSVQIKDGVPYLELGLECNGTFEYRERATGETDTDDSDLYFCAGYQYLDGAWTPVEYGDFSY